MTKSYSKKIKLGVANRHTKWAPFWTVLKLFGPGKRVHPSQVTKHRRHWRRVKLKIKPRRMSKTQLG